MSYCLKQFGAGIEVPSSHLAAGIVEPVAWAMAPEKRVITIRSSEKRPDDATVRIRFRDRWFYVDATDTDSKRAFMFLRTFVGIRLADPGAAQQAPVLTVPVNCRVASAGEGVLMDDARPHLTMHLNRPNSGD